MNETMEHAGQKRKTVASSGDVKCNKLPYRFGAGDKKWPKIDEYKNINVCSSARGVWSQLSPMKIGPVDFVELLPSGAWVARTAQNFENMWQSAKVWPGEEASNGFPTQEWYERRAQICADLKPRRHIKKGVVPLYSWWQGKKLSYDEARRHMYIPMYMELVRRTEAWRALTFLVEKKQTNVQLLGYDGRSFVDLNDELRDLTKPFGHELVLCAMLLGVQLQ